MEHGMKLCAIHQIEGIIQLEVSHAGEKSYATDKRITMLPISIEPFSGAPYIRGSALKGKMRSLLEASLLSSKRSGNQNVARGLPCSCGKRACPVCALFGSHKAPLECDADLGSTRLLVRNACLSDADMEFFKSGKLQISINYGSSTCIADKITFKLNMALKVYDGDAEDLYEWVFLCLKLLELDDAGRDAQKGRRIVFENLTLDAIPLKLSMITMPEAGALP